MQGNIEILIQKLDGFVRKYYKNLLIRGSLLCFSLLLFSYLSIILLDHYAAFSTTGRSFLFYGFLGTFVVSFYTWIVDPLIRYYRLGKVISHEQAASIIGQHFNDVNDKVLNTLQLHHQAELSSQQIELIQASIDQRITELKPIPFTAAIDLRKNARYLRFVLPPLFAGIIILFAAPSLLREGTLRLVNYNNEYLPEMPFRFIIENKLETVEQSDFELKLKLEGDVIPDEVYIETENGSRKMEKMDKLHFTYILKNVGKNVRFHLLADGFRSTEYELKTIPNPSLLSFEVQLNYPKYTGMSAKTLNNSGDLTIPEGTDVKWIIRTKNTEELIVALPDTHYVLKQMQPDRFQFSARIFKGGTYTLRTRNKFTEGKDSLSYLLNVIADQNPAISVDEQIDSTSLKRRFFAGEVTDDYGFTRLSFNYRFLETNDSINDRELHNVVLPLNYKATADRFVYFWDLTSLNIAPGDQIEYYFVISDNDGIHGPKSTRSVTRVFKAPSLDEISANTDKNNEQIKNDLENALKQAQKLNKEIKDVKQNMLEKKNLDWQDQVKLENLMQKHQQLQQQIENIQKENKMNNLQKTEFSEMNEELLEKQKMLEELFEKLMTEDMKKLYEEIQKLMEKLDKTKLQDKIEKTEVTNKELEKELDRALELFKQMEFDQKMEKLNEKLSDLAKKQEELSNDTKDKKESQEKLEARQEELNKEFEEAKKELEELRKLNEELEEKKNIPDTQESEKKISDEQQNSKKELGDNKNKKASESQKKAADEMNKMQQELQSAMESAEMQQAEEDMDAIRALLENLITLSFDQEELMKELAKTPTKDPKYVKLGQQQRKLKDDAKLIEDSLFALSKRQVAIQSVVNKEIAQVNRNMNEAIDNIGERRTAQANANEQYVMTSLNNLALMLDQSLQQMQQQMNSQKPGSGSCKKPGKGAPKPGEGKPGKGKPADGVKSIKQMQEQMAKALEQMKKQLDQQGGKKPGEKPGNGSEPGMGMPGQNGQMSQQLAEMAAQQEALRRKLMELSNELNQDGSGNGNELKEIADQMDKMEEDIVNKNITRETLFRQQEIMTRLLESEKALRERELDEKRESTEAKNEEISNSFEFLQYKRQKEKELELLRTIPPALTPYYKNRVNEYFNIIVR